MTNPYCKALGIAVPSIEKVKDHREASTYSLMIVALLEHGGPMTLREVADRFNQAGIGPAEKMLRSLKRCRPGRAPIYRDGDSYDLDPHDRETDLWAFRLGLRPPKVPLVKPVPAETEPLPGPEVPLTVEELDEAFQDAWLANWSAQRLALAVLDSRGGRMAAARVLETLNRRTRDHRLREESSRYWRGGSPVRVASDGDWVLDASHSALRSAREAVRARIEVARRHAAGRVSPDVLEAHRRRIEAERAAQGAKLARLSRVLVHAFPRRDPEAVVLLDVGARECRTYLHSELDDARAQLARYDLIAAVEVRSLLRALGFDPQARRLDELGPPQKTRKLNRRGRTLKITTELLVQGSCGIARPFSEEAKLLLYLREGQTTRLRRRLEADAKSLYALYQYGRLHGALRLRWGFLDENIPAPWAHWDEPRLYDLLRKAHDSGSELEVVIGGPPGWADPWARACRCRVVKDPRGYGWLQLDDDGFAVDDCEVQLARLVDPAA